MSLSDIEGFVVTVVDGKSFDLQLGGSSGGVIRGLQVGHIVVPGAGTCEAVLARSLLANLIAGKKVRVDGDGKVWRGDLDVGKAMVLFGMAKAADGLYAAEDAQSPDAVCGASTVTTLPLPPLPTVKAKPKPKVTLPKVTLPKTTPAPVTDPPLETPPAGDPEPITG